MSRALNVGLDENTVKARCSAEQVGISAMEALPGGGVRLVCMSMDGAETMRRKFKGQLIKGEVSRERHRPRTSLW
jgi:hypothetical protein